MIAAQKRRIKNIGFTLVEVLMVLAVSITLAGLTLPVGFRFFQSQLLDEAASGIQDALSRAATMANLQKNDSTFGIKFLPGQYTLFQGNFYSARVLSQDENFTLAQNISIIGPDEIVFTKRFATATPAVFTVKLGQDTETISVNELGVISHE